MALSKRSQNRYMLTLRLNKSDDRESTIIDRLSEMDGGAHRGWIVDAATAYINSGEPMPRRLTNAEQTLLLKKAVRDTITELAREGLIGSFQSQSHQPNGHDVYGSEFEQTNQYEDIADSISDNVIRNLGF